MSTVNTTSHAASTGTLLGLHCEGNDFDANIGHRNLLRAFEVCILRGSRSEYIKCGLQIITGNTDLLISGKKLKR